MRPARRRGRVRGPGIRYREGSSGNPNDVDTSRGIHSSSAGELERSRRKEG
jgi:hypothetical protein